MATNDVIYTDGQDVVVTPSTFQVKNTFYRLNGITKHGLAVVGAERIPGILLFVFGVVISLLGIGNMLPVTLVEPVTIGSNYMDVNEMAQWIGIALATIGVIAVSVVKEKYAVRIATAEGEKNVVVSDKREYINQIINALNRALMNIQEPLHNYSRS